MSNTEPPSSPQSIPPGWYPAPHAGNQLRYWDGAAWLEQTADTSEIAQTVPFEPAAQPAVSQTNGTSGRVKGLALSALIVGIVAFLIGLVPFVGVLAALAAVVLAIFAMVRRQPKGLAVAGLVLGALGLIAGSVSTAVFANLDPSDIPAASVSDDSPEPRASAPEPEKSEPAPTEKAPDPTPSKEAAPAPTEPDGSAAHPLPQPYTAEGLFGGAKYILTGRISNADASAQVKEWNMFNDEPPAGFKYVIAEITMEGVDPDGVEPSLAAFDLFLATGEGNRYDPEFTVFGDGMHALNSGPKLYPGNKFTGYAAYVVPASASSFLLYDNRNYVSF